MKKVIIYTDGACSGNPGPGGWGAVLLYQGHRLEMSGGEPQTTNNRMELQAAISALQKLNEPCDVELFSDSSYLVDAFNKGWLAAWQKRGWRKADKSPVLNQELWQQLLALSGTHRISWQWVKGHASTAENNRCDELARQWIYDHYR